MYKIRVQDYRDAAERLAQDMKPITVAGLALELKKTYNHVEYVLTNMDWLRKELGISPKFQHLPRYRIAAERLRAQGEMVTADSMSKMLGSSRVSVRDFLKKHAAFAQSIEYYPPKKAILFRKKVSIDGTPEIIGVTGK